MSKKSKKRVASKSKIRIFMALIIFGSVIGVLGYNCLTNVIKINDLRQEKKELQNKLVSLEEEKETLETDILKLKDTDYIGKYVREKYFYSKEGELILRIDD